MTDWDYEEKIINERYSGYKASSRIWQLRAVHRLALLRRYEWVDVFIDNGGYGDKWIKQCLCCKSEQDDGHADGCKMAEELGK